MITIFSTSLNQKIQAAPLDAEQKYSITSQVHKLGAIDIPNDFNAEETLVVRQAIKKSFVSGFRAVVALNAILAALGAFIAAKTIKINQKHIN